jgi:hypothetical protein
MNLTNAAESSEVARTFGLTSEEHEHLNTQLLRGECVIKLASDWRYPILTTFPQDTTSKHVAPGVWAEAIDRTNRLAPSNPIELVAARDESEGTGQRLPAVRSPARNSPGTLVSKECPCLPFMSPASYMIVSAKISPMTRQTILTLNDRLAVAHWRPQLIRIEPVGSRSTLLVWPGAHVARAAGDGARPPLPSAESAVHAAVETLRNSLRAAPRLTPRCEQSGEPTPLAPCGSVQRGCPIGSTGRGDRHEACASRGRILQLAHMLPRGEG